jgi:hypothetical protein
MLEGTGGVKVLLVVATLAAVPADERASDRQVTLAAAAFSSAEDQVSADSPLAEVQIDHVWMSFENVGFRDVATCDTARAAQVKGPITTELVGGRAIGMPEHVKLGGPYCGLGLDLRRSRGKTDGVPASLRGYSILLRARRTDGTRIVIRSKSERRVWMAARDDDGFSATGEVPRWFLAADLARWLTGLDLVTADIAHENGTPVIRIDDRNNRTLLADFEETIATGLGLYDDADRDGILQTSERSGRSWLAAGE